MVQCVKYVMCVKCEMRDMRDIRAMCAMQIFDFGYMQRDVTLIFDLDHNLIILFLISLRIWSIGVDVKLTQQDVKNSHLQIAPPYHPFCKVAK